MNGWRSRLVLSAVFLAVNTTHNMVTEPFPNTPGWMLVYHGSAAAVDYLLLRCSPWFIAGQLCDDIEALCFASMFANSLGWALYMAKIPPEFYDTLTLGIIYVQYFRLLLMDRHDAHTFGRALFRGLAGSGPEFHPRKAHS